MHICAHIFEISHKMPTQNTHYTLCYIAYFKNYDTFLKYYQTITI